MNSRDIKWDLIRPVIGRWKTSEAHACQIKYELISEADNPFVFTEFVVDFGNETVSTGWREELSGHPVEVPLTQEERAEAEQMIKDMKEHK